MANATPFNSDNNTDSQQAQLTEKEDLRLRTVFSHGDVDELFKVLLAITCYKGLGNHLSAIFYFIEPGCFMTFNRFAFRGPVVTRAIDANGREIISPPRPPVNPLSQCNQWRTYVHDYFCISLNEKYIPKYDCSRFNDDYKPISPQIRLEICPPSQHDRLEAALFLRDWAKDKIPPQELKLLLPKL